MPGTPHGVVRYGLVAPAGAAMGLQSAAGRRLKVPGVATTYITGTWTALSSTLGAWIGSRRPAPGRDAARQCAVVAVYPAAALTIGAAYTAWHAYAMLIPTALLAAAVTDLTGRDRRPPAAGPGRSRRPGPGRC